ncbi:MAG: hypothetical protein IKU51_00005 [Clostridia bacterium]|nr:hypothetical protein [Clostridia bacterium]
MKQIKRTPILTATYVILRLIVVSMLALNLLQGDYESAFICALALVLFMIPAVLERRLRIDIPSLMEMIILLFIFAAEILGELQSYYLQYPHWDTMLHTVNGFLCAAIGFSLIDILTRNKQEKFRLTPLYVSLVAFCFSMTIGVLWEFFEYGMDVIFHTDMQKDTLLGAVYSVALGNGPVVALEDISTVVINGQPLTVEGYLDIGLHDTMADLFVNFIGAVVFSVLGYFYIKHRGKGRAGWLMKHLLPTLEEENDPPEASENNQ